VRLFQLILLIILGACEARNAAFTLADIQTMIEDDEFRTPIVTVLTIPF